MAYNNAVRAAATTIVFLLAAVPAGADTAITVDGLANDWPADAFGFSDAEGDMPPPYADIRQVMITNDNTSGGDGYLYLGIEFYSNFRPNVGSHDVDVYVYLDINQDGDVDDPEDRIVELTGDPFTRPPTPGAIWDGSGNLIAYLPAGDWAYRGRFMEARLSYAVLGLEHGADSFGVAFATDGHPAIDERSPEADGFIFYPGGDAEPLAVRLLGFSATAGKGGVRLKWATGSERDNVGFHIFRQATGGRPERITERPVPGQLDAAAGESYRFLDSEGRAGDVYWLEDIELGGRRHRHGPQMASFEMAAMPSPRREKKTSAGGAAGAQETGASLPAKLSARREWLYFVPRELLLPGSAGLVLERRGGPVPLLQNGAGWFFLGLPERDRYADYEVLVASPGRGRRMQERRVSDCLLPADSVRVELPLEENRLYYVASPRPDPFYWASAFPGAEAEVEFDAPGLLSAPAELGLEICGASPDGPHRIRIVLNGAAAGEFACAGRDVCTFAFPTDGLSERGNRLRLVVLSEDDVVFLDRLLLRYQRRLRLEGGGLRFAAPAGACLEISGLPDPQVVLLEATDPSAPTRLLPAAVRKGGDGYRVVFRDGRPGGGERIYQVFDPSAAERPGMLGAFRPAPLDSPALATDYLVVHHPDFSAAAERLCARQRLRGLSCLAVDTGAIFDSFAFGRPGAQPIRSLLQTAFSRWAVAPRYVLLFGGATVDSNDYLGQGNRDFVPTAFIRTRRGWEAASDAWYVLEGDQARAAIGRLAVENAEEAMVVVEKLGAQQPPRLGRLLFVADRNPAEPQVFERAIDSLIAACLPPQLEAERLLVRESQDAANELRAGIEAGVDAVLFFGHAFLSGWSSPPLVTSQTAAGYDNRQLFLALSMSCFDGAFAGPWAEALSWAWVKNPSGGAWGTLAFSSLSDPAALRIISEQLLCGLTSGEVATVGEVLRLVREHLSGIEPNIEDTLDTLNLLGDPATPNPFLP